MTSGGSGEWFVGGTCGSAIGEPGVGKVPDVCGHPSMSVVVYGVDMGVRRVSSVQSPPFPPQVHLYTKTVHRSLDPHPYLCTVHIRVCKRVSSLRLSSLVRCTGPEPKVSSKR